ncbi:MAG: protoporphyrinogen oxidase [Bacteroidota bacterium]
MESESADVVIIGGGISGLAAAHWLAKAGLSVRVLEQESGPGGTMKTRHEEGFLSELGPNSALETTPLIASLVSDLGLANDFLYARPSSKNRFILKNGRLCALPSSPLSFLTTDLFSVGAKFRLLKEPFVGRALKEESIAEFVTRRLGREFLDYAIDPFVAGIFAARPEALSVRAAFPKLYALEATYGGLIKGMILGRKKRKARQEQSKDRAKSFSFSRGMQSLPLRLGSMLGERVSYNATATGIRVRPSVNRATIAPNARQYVIDYLHGDQAKHLGGSAVVIATPAGTAGRLVLPLSQTVAKELASIEYPPVVSVFLGYREHEIGHPLNGFGFLVPSLERKNILGCLWSSSLFPYRAPEGFAGLTVFVGGGRQPELTTAGDDDVLAMVLRDLETIMQIRGKPVYWSMTRWKHAIPQYVLGYDRVMNALSNFEQTHRGLFFCSNFRGGISVGDCIQNSELIAHQARAYLKDVAS